MYQFRKPKQISDHKFYPHHESDVNRKNLNTIEGQWYSTIVGLLRQYQNEFAIPLERLSKRYDTSHISSIILHFKNLHPAFYIRISRYYACEVFIDHANKSWDIIFDSDISPKQRDDGTWVCDMNESAHRSEPNIYPLFTEPSLKALCETQMILPLMDWVKQLANSDYLCLYQTKSGGISWARLEKAEVNQAERCQTTLLHEQFSASLIRIDEDPSIQKEIPTQVDDCKPKYQLPILIA